MEMVSGGVWRGGGYLLVVEGLGREVGLVVLVGLGLRLLGVGLVHGHQAPLRHQLRVEALGRLKHRGTGGLEAQRSRSGILTEGLKGNGFRGKVEGLQAHGRVESDV